MESLVPPLLTIILCFATRKVLPSLLAGIISGCFIYNGFAPVDSVSTFFKLMWGVISDRDYLLIIAFTLTLGAMSGALIGSRGMAGFIGFISRYAKGRRSGQVISWLAGLVVFFDDYANSLIVGNSLRNITDKMGISRQKLSYIVDSTAAPVATLAVISTWIGYKVGIINTELTRLGDNSSGFVFFINTLPYSYYSIFTIFFVLAVAVMNRDFGPMLKAERKYLAENKIESGTEAQGGAKSIIIFLPVLLIVITAFYGLYTDGLASVEDKNAPAWEVIGEADVFLILTYAGFVGLACMLLVNQVMGYNRLKNSLKDALGGLLKLLPVTLILVSAWGIHKTCNLVGTPEYLKESISSFASPNLLPPLFFATACFVSFTTGTSWGTMAIVTPIAMQTAWSATPDEALRLATTASVLGGAIFGDHCTPISDTTILSSIACDVKVMDHTMTQLPYGIASAAIAVLVGYLPVGFGMPWFVSLPTGITVAFLFVRFFGKPTTNSILNPN